MRASDSEISRAKWLVYASLVLGVATTAYVSVLALQVSVHVRSSVATTTTVQITANSTLLVGQPVSAGVLSELEGVSTSTLSAVGRGASSVVSPSSISNASPLSASGRPEVLYIGGEFCPYCAIERWALIIALSRFGNFTGLEYMLSSSTDVYNNTATFTFANASYTSSYVAFTAVEEKDRNGNSLQTPTSEESALFGQYDSAQSIPFVDFGNSYLLVGSQVIPTVLRVGGSATGAPLNWTQIASQLNTPSSSIAQNIDGAANRLVSAICDLTGAQPSSVCSQSFAHVLAYVVPPRSVGGALAVGRSASPSLEVATLSRPGATPSRRDL